MSNGESFVANLIAARGNRVTASILGYLEEQVYRQVPQIPTELQKRIRQVVLDQVNGFKDLAIDIVKSDTDHINEHWATMLAQIHDGVQKLQKAEVG